MRRSIVSLSLLAAFVFTTGVAEAGPWRRHRGPRLRSEIRYVVPMREMSEARFRVLLQQIRETSFSSSKMDVIATAASANWFNVLQLRRVLQSLSFSSDRERAIELMGPRVLDRQNAYLLYDVLTFSSERETVRRVLQ